jgi:trehalose/maltose transport system permease protein
MLVALVLVAGWPLLRTIWLSATDATLFRTDDARFVGFGNYFRYEDGRWHGLCADPHWWRAVENTLLFTFSSVSLETVLGFIVALVLNSTFRARGFVRAAMLIPWAIPTIVSAKMWGLMLNDQFGVVNHLLRDLGVIQHPLAWTADPDLVMMSVVLVDVWKTTPFMALLILAALQMLPRECYEAARVDGVGPLKVWWRITLPLVRPALLVAVIFRALDAMRVFDLIYVLTSNNDQSMTMSVYARQQLVDFQEIGYGSAAATLLFAIIAGLTLVVVIIGGVRPREA